MHNASVSAAIRVQGFLLYVSNDEERTRDAGSSLLLAPPAVYVSTGVRLRALRQSSDQ